MRSDEDEMGVYTIIRDNTSDPMADMDSSGNVNLFDYVIDDRNFGAQGE